MPNTSNQQLPYPAVGDSPNGPTQISALATATEPRLVQKFTSSADRTTRRGSPAEGELSYLSDLNQFEWYDGTAWRIWHRQNLLASTSIVEGTYDATRPIWHWGGYFEGVAAANSAVAVNPTPAGKTVSAIIAATATSSFKFGETGSFQNTVVVLDQVATTASSVVFVFYDVTNMGSGIGAAIVGFSWDIQFQTTS